MKIISLEEMGKAAHVLLSCVEEARETENGALILLLSGELGSGKTTFVQALAQELGVEERLTSPTFVIQKEYAVPKSSELHESASLGFERLIHIDAYRLKSFSELEMLGWSTFIQDPRTIIALEWPEQVGITPAPPRTISLTFSHVEESVRNLLFNGKETMC
ncbi:MAG: tRNA (adenosine(37)-N6)-threonylcarbamoyltransferase complex ATPase subunit type 1 TsaE [Candidatus Paceibacterota bacterium]